MKMGRCNSFNLRFCFSLLLFVLFVQKIDGLKFIVEPEDTIVPKGASVVLNCAARGDGQPRISWKKDGTQLTFVGDLRNPDDPDYFGRSILANGSLHITSLLRTRETRPDEGLYQCVASLEGVGSIVSRSAKLQAASLARFDEEPEDISVGIGQTARFGCSAQGIPQPSVAWLKDDAALELNASRMIVLPSGSLEISQIRASDEGIYRCNLSNVDKAFISRSGRLVHNTNPERDTPPLFTAVPKSQTVLASKSVVLECSAVSYPKPTITWLKDGVTLDLRSTESRYSFVGEGNLKILKVEESDKGTYQCRAENREDSNDVSAALDIHVPPKASIIPTNFYAYEKEDIELPCKIYGKPTPTIQWVKNGNMILEGDYFQIVHGNNLKILGLVDTDAGMYQCFGTNPSGNVQSSVHLRVLKPGEEMPESEVDDEESELNLGQSLPASRGNSGSTSGLSSAPREVSIMFVSTRFITLSWKPPATTNGRILAYAIFYKESSSDRERVLNTTTKSSLEELNIPELQPNKTYNFRVVPYNEKGAGASSKEISVTTSPELGVPGSPRNVKAWAISPTQAKVEWAPPENTNELRQKYKVYFVEVQEEGSDVIPHGDKVLEDFEDFDEDDDDDDYFLSKSDGIQVVTVDSTEAILDELRVFTEYFVWVVAVNEHGPSPNSEQVKMLTLSDAPGDTPHNVSVESQSSTSLVVRWEPPPKEFINGVITGYKLKYKQKGKKKAETVTTDGNSRFFSLNELERGAEFQVKIAALNVNGSGPFTEWINAATFHKDLDESQVPGEPASLQARALSDSITISWSPPKNANTMVRGFTIGWGKGIPDVYTKLVDGKRRVFTIDKLRPNSEYVISLRAFNNVGDGVPVYENVRTRVTSEEEDELGPSMAQLPPPVGLRAIVLSPVSVVLSWMDTSLPKRQVVTDNRYYVVRYLPADDLLKAPSQKKSIMKLMNTTQLNVLIDDLKPGTPYEFSVKVVKNRHSSEWSLDALNTTFTPQHSPPQDLTLLAITGEDGTSSVILNWQPPVSTTNNDEMKGYLVFYTTNPSLKEWVEEPIPDDVLTHRVQGLTPETKYFFRMAAKHSKGFGPHTEIKSVETPAAKNNNRETTPVKPTSFEYDEKSNQILLYVLIALSLTFAFASVSLCIYYKKRGSEPTPKQTPIKKCRKPELKPPDLWIHHDQMELKSIEKGAMGQRSETPITPSTRGSREFGDPEEKMPLQQSTNSLDKRNFMSSYIAGDISHSSHSLGRRKPKPIKIPVEPFFFQKDVGGGGELARNPTFSRNSQIQSQFRDVSDGHKTYESMQSGSSNASSQHNLAPNIQYSATSDYGTTSGGSTLGTLGRRTGGNLKSFAVPIPPSTPHNKVNIRPTTSSSALPTGIPASPVKRISTSHMPPPPFPSLSPRSYCSDDPQLQKCYSTEELSQEISNLEGLMKDLNAITASEFQC